MALRINFNYSAAVTQTALEANNRLMNKSLMRLSTGLRILNAADDSAGLFIADQLAIVSAGLEQGNRNIQTGISALQIAENSAGQIYNRLKQIYVKAQNAANDINDPNARSALQREINSDGSFTGKYIHYGPRSGQVVNISISNLQASQLGAYTASSNGTALVDNAKGLDDGTWDANYLVSGTDNLTITVGSTSESLTGSDLGVTNTDFGGNVFVDAARIAESINSNSTFQQLGISATALKLYVGDTKVFDKTYSQSGVTVNGSTVGVGPDLDTLIQDINSSVLNGGLLTATKDSSGTKLKLVTSDGQTVLAQVDVSLTATDSDSSAESINLDIDLGKILPN